MFRRNSRPRVFAIDEVPGLHLLPSGPPPPNPAELLDSVRCQETFSALAARYGDPETRRRIHEAAKRLGYVPNEVARQLRAQRTNTLGLLGDEVTTTPFAGRMVLGAQEAASKNELEQVLAVVQWEYEKEKEELLAQLAQARQDFLQMRNMLWGTSP